MNQKRNSTIWLQKEVYGNNEFTELDNLLTDKIISENLFKFTFDKNIIAFISVILDKQLNVAFTLERYNKSRVEVSSQRDGGNGLSGIDKLEMNLAKADESILILSDLNKAKVIDRLKKSMHMTVTDNEIEYYRRNLKITKFQQQLVFYYYAKYFNGYRDLNLLNAIEYLTLLILLKKRLRYQGNIYLPEIISSNAMSRLNSRTIKNDKFLTKIGTSSLYEALISDKFRTLDEIGKSQMIINILSTILNSTFTYVDYDHPEMLGEEIVLNQDAISDEFLNFLYQI